MCSCMPCHLRLTDDPPDNPCWLACLWRDAATCAQYAHLHGMTARGLVSLDATFQGRYTPALEAAGGVLANLLTEGRSIHPVYGRFLVNYAAKPITVAFGTRHLFEQTARKLVASNDRVQFMYGATAAGLEFGGAAQAAEGGGSNTAVTGGLESVCTLHSWVGCGDTVSRWRCTRLYFLCRCHLLTTISYTVL